LCRGCLISNEREVCEDEKVTAENSNSSRKSERIEEEEARQLPSYVLAHSPQYFHQLFQLLTLDDETISGKVWELLLGMPTSQDMMDNIRSFYFSTTTANWNELFDTKSIFKLLYSLQIVDAILFPLDDLDLNLSFRSNWCLTFLQRQGLSHLQSAFFCLW